mgnify:CR=1 FL=1
MNGFKINCPNCGRVLGDTNDSMNARLNCRGCKKTVDIKIIVAHCADYLNDKKEEEKDDES